MMKDERATLDALIEPASSILFFVKRYGECLSSTIVDCVYDSDVELLRVFSQMVGA